MKAVHAFLLLVIACSACTDRDPVIVQMTSLTLGIPRGEEFTRIHLSDRDTTGRPSESSSVSFRICEQHVRRMRDAACEAHGGSGTWVLVTEPPPGATFSLLKERPLDEGRPPEAGLRPLSGRDARDIRFGSAHAAEASTLLRVRSKVWGDDPELSTTDRGWPVADCDQHPQGGVGCRFGFLVNGTPVVAQWFSQGDQKGIAQAQVWDVASDIDRRLRRLTLGAAPRQPD